MSKNLLIVESPAKAKTIEKYLGEDFSVTSCYGHIRDLSKGNKAIDVDNQYQPSYEVPEAKKDVVKQLKKMAKKADDVWLATDEDREGEAISWHLCEVLGLNKDKTKRIVFHEITKPAILKAVSKPRSLNQNLVDAQQARRILDRLVGFEISPVLWRKIAQSGSLSAGRVQSVAVRIIVEREREIENFERTSYFKVSGYFPLFDESIGKDVILKAELSKKLKTEEEALAFLEKCKGADYTIDDIQVKPGKKSPPAPFTTSTLQQDASRKLGFSVSRTMSVAQKLYEAGKITYMRTDSPSLSETAIGSSAETILARYGEDYQQTRQFKSKNAGAQEAHEAIRPTYFDQPEAGESSDEQRLYELIWKRTMASQMSDAKLERTTASIGISTTSERLLAKGEVLKFDGFLKVYRESKLDDEEEEKENSSMLPPLKVGQVLKLRDLNAVQRFNRPPARFNEATLVKKLEELGIGRPSTYAPTISTIQKRNYVVKEDREGVLRTFRLLKLSAELPQKVESQDGQERTGVEKSKLFATDVGIVVNDFLVKHFEDILNYGFTAEIEKKFDKIAEGGEQWNAMIDSFYKPFKKSVEYTLENAERSAGEKELGFHPENGKRVIARLGKYGPMVQIGSPDDEEKPVYAKLRQPYTINSISLQEALDLFKLPRIMGEFQDLEVKVNEGRFGPYVMHNKKFASIPKEMDPMTITLDECIVLIKNKQEADAKKLILDYSEHDIQVLNGRWGPYIKAGKKNVKIPKDKEPETLTLEECQKLVAEAPEKKPRRKKK